MTTRYQERIFLTLVDDTKENILVKEILKSPLGLASELVRLLFEDDFTKLKDELDEIKSFVAGISRAERIAISSNYSLASYYPYMFSFHQFFNSSFRARQGKVLEKMLINIIRNYTTCDVVPEKASEMLDKLSILFKTKLPKLDIDAMGLDTKNNKTMIVQLRSRDDTGGTTAKESLVDLLRVLLRTKQLPSQDILYLVCIWDIRGSQQKKSTIGKMYSSLKDWINITENDFLNDISKGVQINEKITLKLAYGTDEIVNSFHKWNNNNNESILLSISKVISFIENWDDLWISYAIANSEIEIKYLNDHSNCKLLDEKCNLIDKHFNFNSYKDLIQSIDEMTNEIIPIWVEDSIPLDSPADKAHYIRDLLFLRACYEKR